MKNKYLIRTFFTLVLLGVAFCESDFFLDTIPPVIIVKKLENEKSLISYSIAGKSASGREPNQASKLFIGRPSKGKGAPERILECTLSRNSNPEMGDIIKVVCNPLPFPGKLSPSSECQRDSNFQKLGPGSFSRFNFTAGLTSSFGSTVAYENDKDRFIACDFKWRETPEPASKSAVRGLCYQSDGSGTGQFSGVMFPTSTSACQVGRTCEDLHYYALLGFSAYFSNSNGLVGMPGYLNYQGAVVRMGQFSSSLCTMSQVRFPNLNNYDYFGYSITSGVYFWKSVQQYAIGSPRGSKGKGKVFIIRLDTPSSAVVDRELHGDKFGSYFGSVLASTDLNGDGFDDLLVGAPMYNKASFDEGCVFVYSRAASSFRTQSFQTPGSSERLCPSDTPGGRFGSSIAPLGDINEDGFGDVAISAPYADNGRVYIYFGGGAGTSRKPVVIDPSPKADISGFGTTIVGNVDLDGNGTPDLAVGSFLSKSIAVYLTRTRVVLSVSFRSDSGSQTTKFKREDSSFILRPLICARLKFAGKTKSLPNRLGVYVKVVADSQVSPNRFLIDPASGNVGLRSVEIAVVLRKDQSGLLCGSQNISVTVVPENLKAEDRRKIAFEWQVRYNETLLVFNSTDVIDVDNQPASRKSEGGSFCFDCPAPKGPDVFNYEVQLEDNCNDDGNPECSPELELSAQFQDNEGKELNDITIGITSIIKVKIVLKNKKESAYNPRLIVRLTSDIINLTDVLTLNAPKCLSNFNSDSATKDLSCQDIVMHKNSPEETFTGTLNFKHLRAKTKPAKILMRVDAFPEGMPQNNRSQEKTLVIKSDVNLKIMAIESKKTPLPDRNISEFVQQFRVQNTKPSPHEKVQFSFEYPKYYGNEKEPVITFVSANSPTVECSGELEKSQSVLKSQVREQRRRRNVKDSKSSEETKVITGTQLPGSSVRVRCGDKEWTCVQHNCTGNFPDNNYREFEIQLNYEINSVLARELNIIKDDLMELSIMTSATLYPFDKINGKPISVPATQTYTIASIAGPTAIELIGAGIIGLILLFLITVGLFKCGFFRRKTKEELEALKAQTEEEENLTRNFPVHNTNGEEDDE